MQFRVGLYHWGSNPTDTNRLGYTFDNPTGGRSGAAAGLYVRNNPNQGTCASGSAGNATRPECLLQTYTSGWGEGTYDFSLSASLVESNAHQIAWSLTGVSPPGYSYAASYKNTNTLTTPIAFDQVGFLGGAALFNSASAANRMSFTNLAVTFGK